VSRDIAGKSIQPDSFQSLTVCKADYFPHHGFCAAMIPEVRVYSENMHNGNLVILQCGLPVNFMVIIRLIRSYGYGSRNICSVFRTVHVSLADIVCNHFFRRLLPLNPTSMNRHVFRFIDYQLIKIQYSGQIALCTSFHGWFSIITVVNFKRAFRYFFPTAIRTNRNR
jgi:hypothetical protein